MDLILLRPDFPEIKSLTKFAVVVVIRNCRNLPRKIHALFMMFVCVIITMYTVLFLFVTVTYINGNHLVRK